MIKDKKKQIEKEKLVLASEISLVPKSKPIEINEQKFDKLCEKTFKKLMKEKNNIEFKEAKKHIDMFNPDNFGLMKGLAKEIKRVLLILFIKICVLKRERDEAQITTEGISRRLQIIERRIYGCKR